jgi:hypothetical protein
MGKRGTISKTKSKRKNESKTRSSRKKKQTSKKAITNSTCSNKCAPGTKPNPKTCSCLSKDSLLKIAGHWNGKNQDNKINYSSKSSPAKLWSSINEKMKDRCKSEWCWVQQEFVQRMKSDDINNAHRPSMPKSWEQNKYEWLKTEDIENVMDQYEEAHPDFYFIGPVPIDFDKPYGIGHCVVDELCKLNLTKVHSKGYRKIGIVFNLDPHDKPGSHWVSMFCDLKGKGIYYFDSYGMKPPNEIDMLMKRLQNQAKLLDINMKIKSNNVRHQYRNSECGVYCLFFITQLLKGNKFHKLIKSPIMDETMNKKRSFFFVGEGTI